MASSIILTLLKFYSSKQRTPVIEFGEFVDYLKRYAQHHTDENPELVVYTSGSNDSLQEELSKLVSERHISMLTQGGKQFIAVINYFMERYTETYVEMERNFSLPFPNMNDLPKHVPADVADRQQASDIIFKLLDENFRPDDKTLYCILFSKGVPGVLLPSTVSGITLVNICLKKLQDLLRKGDSHDYFQKKITGANPGKEISIKNFFTSFMAKPEETWLMLRSNGDSFYYWNQLCYFIKQDCTKMKDFNAEDINVLQTVGIIEVAASFYKNKASEKLLKDAAFKALDEQLLHPPYYFTMDDIMKFKDANGNLLVTKYTESDLKDHLEYMTSQTVGAELPTLLSFKINDMQTYLILKEKVMPLIVRLCNDARELIRESLAKSWYKYMLDYETLPEMKEQPAFERCLERELKVCSPILYGILTSSFLPVLSYDDKTPGKIPLYRDGLLIPYSELLLLRRTEIYSSARIKLPFWYTIPVFSWIVAAIKRKSKEQRRRDSEKSATEKVLEDEKNKAAAKQTELDAKDGADPKKARKKELRHAAANVESQIVPGNSTIDRELDSYMQEWNDRISKQAHDDLVEDINTLIRDYTRKTLRSLKTENLTRDRVASLAEALVDTPSLMKVKNHPALKRYIELYMVKLIKNLP
ncbi:MAG: hypothetical protein J5930_04105 [Treponema sp.]|nr:hypothetical protein [Treponema sp.]